MDEVRDIERMVRERGVKAITGFPCGLCPQVPINDKRWYPIYAKCVELDVPICMCVGVPGPRLPMGPQKVELIDEVCWFFPELRFVMRHGGRTLDRSRGQVDAQVQAPLLHDERVRSQALPGVDRSVRKHPWRPQDHVCGYFPMGLSLERIFRELPNVPFVDDVWPKFLRENAIRVFKL